MLVARPGGLVKKSWVETAWFYQSELIRCSWTLKLTESLFKVVESRLMSRVQRKEGSNLCSIAGMNHFKCIYCENNNYCSASEMSIIVITDPSYDATSLIDANAISNIVYVCLWWSVDLNEDIYFTVNCHKWIQTHVFQLIFVLSSILAPLLLCDISPKFQFMKIWW